MLYVLTHCPSSDMMLLQSHLPGRFPRKKTLSENDISITAGSVNGSCTPDISGYLQTDQGPLSNISGHIAVKSWGDLYP